MSRSDFTMPATAEHQVFDNIVINHRPPTVRSAPLPNVDDEEDDNDPTPRPSVSSQVSTHSLPKPIPQRRHSSAHHNSSRHSAAAVSEREQTHRRRETTTLFRAIDWRGKETAKEASLKRQSPPSSSSSSTRSGKSQKESGGLIRKFSQRGNKLQKAMRDGFGSRSRPSSSHGEAMEGVEETAPIHGFFTRLNASRLAASGKALRYDTPAPVNNGATSAAVPPAITSSKSYPPMYLPGEAARRSAALHNFEIQRNQNRQRIGSLSSAADSGADLGSNADIDMIDITDSEEEDISTEKHMDPTKVRDIRRALL